MSTPEKVVFGTEDILLSLCNSVSRVLTVATQSPIHFSGMVQRITKTCLKPTSAASSCSTVVSRGWS